MDCDLGRVADGLHPEVSGIAVDAQLFHEAGCRLVHKYRVYKDPFPHPAFPGGVLPRLLSLVGQAMAITQLTQLRISIPASGASPGQVPEECFPGGTSSRELTSPRRASFASDVTVLAQRRQVTQSLARHQVKSSRYALSIYRGS